MEHGVYGQLMIHAQRHVELVYKEEVEFAIILNLLKVVYTAMDYHRRVDFAMKEHVQ